MEEVQALATLLATHPEEFFAASKELRERVRGVLKLVFDLHAKQTASRKAASSDRKAGAGAASQLSLPKPALPELYTEGLDEEQIWGEVSMQQTPLLKALEAQVAAMAGEASEDAYRLLPAHAAASRSGSGSGSGSSRAGRQQAASSEDDDEEEEQDDEEEDDSEESEDESLAQRRARKRARVAAEDEEDEDSGKPAKGKTRKQQKASKANAGKKSAGADDADDLESFLREGDRIERKLKRAAAGRHGGDDEEDDEDGSEEEDDEDDLSVDLNAPLPDEDDADGESGAGAKSTSKSNSKSKKQQAGASKEERLRALRAAGPRFEDLWGPKKGNKAASSEDDAGDDEEEEEEEQLDGSASEEDGEEDGEDGVDFSSEEEDFIDGGLGVEEGEDDEDEDDEDDEDGEEENEEEEEDDGAAARAARRRKLLEQDEPSDDDDYEEHDADAMGDAGEEDEEEEEEEDGGSDSGSGSGGAPKRLSKHEMAKAKLAEQIAALETEAMADKPWLLTGEVVGNKRPENSLLGAEVDYQQVMKLAPTVTVETTAALEDLIRQRILDAAFDDPVRKEPPAAATSAGAGAAGGAGSELSTEKSGVGLGDVYAQQYAATVLGVMGEDKVKKLETECEALVTQIFHKLDALSNYHYTPKPPTADMAVTPNVAAIAMEEVLPLAVSDATARAPEEVYARKKGREGVLQTKGEMSAEQREAARRAKKTAKRKEKAAREAEERAVARINPGLGNKYTKQQALEDIRKAGNVVVGDGVKSLKGSKLAGQKRGRSEMSSGGGGGRAAEAPSGTVKGIGRFSNSSEFFATLQQEAQQKIAAGKSGGGANGGAGAMGAGKAPSASARLKL